MAHEDCYGKSFGFRILGFTGLTRAFGVGFWHERCICCFVGVAVMGICA